jgi:hypothetical protein
MANGRCHVAFADPGTSGDQQVLVTGDKRAVGQAHDLVTVDAAVGMVMDVFNHGFITEAGLVDLPLYAAVVTVIPLSVHQVPQQLISRIIISFPLSRLVLKAWNMP